MSNKSIEIDHKLFRRKVEKLVRRGLTDELKNGKLFGKKGKNGVFSVPIKSIDVPHFIHGDQDFGISRGPGKEGDVIGQEPPKGGNKNGGGGNDDGNPMNVHVDIDDVIDFVIAGLELPRLKPKPSRTFEDVQYKYNSISMAGPESLRHNRRTWNEAMKRMASTGELGKTHVVPGFTVPVRSIQVIQRDKRYRQRREIYIPCNNAVVLLMRDGSGSMNEEKREIASTISWWIEKIVGKHYKKIETAYIWHDTKAREVDRDTWYDLSDGGGTACSSAYMLADELFEYKYPPSTWNIYPFHFTDGDNWESDNTKLITAISEIMPPTVVNMLGVVQMLVSDYPSSVKSLIDAAIESGQLEKGYIRTVSIGPEETPDHVGGSYEEATFGDDDGAKYKDIKKALERLFDKRESVAGTTGDL